MNTDINNLNLDIVQEIEDSHEEEESKFFHTVKNRGDTSVRNALEFKFSVENSG